MGNINKFSVNNTERKLLEDIFTFTGVLFTSVNQIDDNYYTVANVMFYQSGFTAQVQVSNTNTFNIAIINERTKEFIEIIEKNGTYANEIVEFTDSDFETNLITYPDVYGVYVASISSNSELRAIMYRKTTETYTKVYNIYNRNIYIIDIEISLKFLNVKDIIYSNFQNIKKSLTNSLYANTYGCLFKSTFAIDLHYYSLDGISFNKSNYLFYLKTHTNDNGIITIAIINEDDVEIVESIDIYCTKYNIVEITNLDFKTDFSKVDYTFGIYLYNQQRIIPLRSVPIMNLRKLKYCDFDNKTINQLLNVENHSYEMAVVIKSLNNIDDVFRKNIDAIIKIKSEITKTPPDLQESLNKSGFIQLEEKIYNITTPLIIPNGTRISGVLGKTIFKLQSGNSIISLSSSSSDITIENITFEGPQIINPINTNIFDIRNRTNEGTKTGIYAYGYAKNIHIKNCEFSNFDLAGIHLNHTFTWTYSKMFKITDCVFVNNWYGLLLDVRSEYHTVIGCSFNYNQIGCFIAGGNNYMSCCHFDKNAAGCVISGTAGDNDSHGSIACSSFNHNSALGLALIDVNNGFTFTGCQVFDNPIELYNCRGINFTGGIISGKIINQEANEDVINFIHDNIFLPNYEGGEITNYDTLDLKNNKFINNLDSSLINN